MAGLTYTRGDIFFCNLPESCTLNYTSVEKGYRPVVIVSSRMGLQTSDITMICPITTKIKEVSINVKISWSKDTRQSQVLCNQIMTIPKRILGECVGRLTDEEIDDVNTAMLISLGIAPSTALNIQNAQENLANARKDAELLKDLIPQAKHLITQLTEVISRTERSKVKITKKGRIKRTPEEVADFIREWNDPHNNRNEVAEAYGFKSYSAAYSFNKSRTKV